MDNSNLDGKSFSFNSLGLEFALFQHNEHLCIKIKETSEDGYLTEEEFAFIEVTSVSNKLRAEHPVEIKDEDNYSLGYLIIGDGKSRKIADLPNIRTAAILYFLLVDQVNNANIDDVNVPPNFESSMTIEDRSILLISKDSLERYQKKYMSGADLWGGFSHRQMNNVEHEITTSLKAISDINFPTNAHKNKAYYSTSSDNSFIRFLSKYQIIELMFDYITVAKIRVSRDNIFEFRDLMSAYGRDDILLLKSILKDYVQDSSTLAVLMYKFAEYKGTSFEIFQKHSKDSNPLKNEIMFGKFWEALDSKKLTYADVNADPTLKFLQLPSIEKGGDIVFSHALTNMVSYWIYRVRCSIAHNKIGEHIFSDTDELFIIDAAEPLLDEVLRQLLTNTDLQKLLAKSKELESYLSN